MSRILSCVWHNKKEQPSLPLFGSRAYGRPTLSRDDIHSCLDWHISAVGKDFINEILLSTYSPNLAQCNHQESSRSRISMMTLNPVVPPPRWSDLRSAVGLLSNDLVSERLEMVIISLVNVTDRQLTSAPLLSNLPAHIPQCVIQWTAFLSQSRSDARSRDWLSIALCALQRPSFWCLHQATMSQIDSWCSFFTDEKSNAQRTTPNWWILLQKFRYCWYGYQWLE